MVLLGILVPRWWGRNLTSERIPAPVDWKLTIGDFVLQASDLLALIVAPITIGLVAWFLGGSRLGLAVRAAAERTDRAQMLGIPVTRLNTLVWAVAAVLASVALFLKSGITGVPLGFAVALPTLLLSLAALVIGRLERLPTVIATAIALTVLEQGVQWNSESPFLAYPIMAAVMFVVLMVQRSGTSRRDLDTTSSWRGVDEVRPVAPDLLAHPGVATLRWTLLAATAMVVVLVPVVLGVDYVIKASALLAFAVIGMSLVVLTGWAGQLSFGQMGIVGVGAAVSATATVRWNADLLVVLVLGGAAGAVAAFVVGLPALRLRGLYLAVTTFAFAVTVESWLLNDRFFRWFPARDRIPRLPLLGRIAIDTPTRFYALSVVVAAAIGLMLVGVRRSRTGRAIVAMRDNERGAQSVAIAPVRIKLTAFTVSGAVAGVGGALLVHLNQSFVVATYGAGESLTVFMSAVIGGLGSLGGAFLGALYLRGTQWFITAPEWQVLSSGAGVLFVLLVLPGGIGGLWVRLRDLAIRLVTRRDVLPEITAGEHDMAVDVVGPTGGATPDDRVVEPA
jgi:branched-chain amino acid transport system permease protein